MLSIFVLLALGGGAIAYLIYSPKMLSKRRALIQRRPFPKAWRNILKRRMPYFRAMPADLQLQLKRHIQVFLAEKRFVGCDGVEITDEIRLTIAAQACLLILNRPTDYFAQLHEILVYPAAFLKPDPHVDAAGIKDDRHRALSGESWQQGKVILSWQDTIRGAADPKDGQNVVIHEFAHQLDQQNGPANGAPVLDSNLDYNTWSAIFSKEFDLLRRNASQGIPSLFDYYGATNPAEFFAVASEVFFEQAHAMWNQHRDLYQALSAYYRVDPVNW